MGSTRRPTRTAARAALAVLAAAAAVTAGWWLLSDRPDGRPPEAALSVAASLAGAASEGYERADRVRPFVFPADHGAHPGFRTEWWYFTGNLADPAGRRFGFQLTFFRSAVAPPADGGEPRDSAWATRQVWMAHLAVTDAAGERFRAAERFARGAAGLAGAEAEPFRVWVGPWRAAALPGGAPGSIVPLRLTAASDGAEIDLVLSPGKPTVLQGDRGFSRKGEGEGQASYYYSLTRMPAEGTLRIGGERFAVAGAAWLDREWSTSVLAPGAEGWDWLALQLDDGREVIAWRVRDGATSGGDGTGPSEDSEPFDDAEPLDDVALVTADGTYVRLDPARGRLEATGRWTSRTTGITYPSGWRLLLPEAGLDLEIEPLLADQELDLAFRYWEGAVRVTGRAEGGATTGFGYVELTGYGESASSR